MRPNIALIVLPLCSLLARGRCRRRATFATLGLAALRSRRGAVSGGDGLAERRAVWIAAGVRLWQHGRAVLGRARGAQPGALSAMASRDAKRRSCSRRRWRPGGCGSVVDPSALLVLVLVAAVVLTMATYLAYTVFDDWWYMRFLLPALPVLLSERCGLRWTAARAASVAGAPAAAIVLACRRLAAWHVQVARTRSRVRSPGAGVAVRGGRAGTPDGRCRRTRWCSRCSRAAACASTAAATTIAWDAIPAGRARSHDRAICATPGRPPFIVLEDEEEPRFRARFADRAARRARLAAAGGGPCAGSRACLRPAARDRYRAGAARRRPTTCADVEDRGAGLDPR